MYPPAPWPLPGIRSANPTSSTLLKSGWSIQLPTATTRAISSSSSAHRQSTHRQVEVGRRPGRAIADEPRAVDKLHHRARLMEARGPYRPADLGERLGEIDEVTTVAQRRGARRRRRAGPQVHRIEDPLPRTATSWISLPEVPCSVSCRLGLATPLPGRQARRRDRRAGSPAPSTPPQRIAAAGSAPRAAPPRHRSNPAPAAPRSRSPVVPWGCLRP